MRYRLMCFGSFFFLIWFLAPLDTFCLRIENGKRKKKQTGGFRWFDHRSSSNMMKVKMRRMKSQKSSSYFYIIFWCFVAEKSYVLLQLLRVKSNGKRRNVKSKKNLYFYDRYCTIADREHVNCYGPPIWDVETEQQEVSCVNVERIWSLFTIKMLAHTQTHTRMRHGEKHDFFLLLYFVFLCVFDLVSHLFLWHSN